ncbi:MAG: paraquat-inducible protein A [Pseudomonadota bacterium]
MHKEQWAKYLNLALVIAFPVAWFAPLMKTGLLPQWKMPSWLGGSTLFAPDEITVVSGLQKLWETDAFLAIAVTFFALVAPMLKCLGMSLIHFNLLSSATRPMITLMGKLAMADIFILALYIVIAKGIGIGRIEVAWGLYLFTACVMISLFVSFVEKDRPPAPPETGTG